MIFEESSWIIWWLLDRPLAAGLLYHADLIFLFWLVWLRFDSLLPSRPAADRFDSDDGGILWINDSKDGLWVKLFFELAYAWNILF